MDDVAKLFAGHMGVATVLVNALADKGVIATRELSDRLREAHTVADGCAGAPASGHALAEMIRHVVGRQADKP